MSLFHIADVPVGGDSPLLLIAGPCQVEGRDHALMCAEALAGILMIGGALMWLSIPVALFIGTIGAVSVFKAVYIDKRDLKCACVGGDSNVPLGFISLTENLMMMFMGIWMPIKIFALGW